ncbi:VRR-NUC domain-containing protein [Micromonospora aurantiaca (nom. illeg.)]|uniref:VRR-NUC domain-containing protein n=1 Tax=Micromonospora aurantiaca (nom. illeg.) TaxID=47850 RepID=UPI001657642E|nr:VRR-NUC domain-containing protein [Micromonospora aurantiaca]MBC9000464.1 VRR-NUC domain-containing protein [Micromonospora aurantiaca]
MKPRLGEDMSEDELKKAVLDLCKTLHLRTAHFRPARTEQGWRTPVEGDGQGWPDLVIAGPGGALFRELKSRTGRVEPDQKVWLSVLTAAGENAGVWRPIDLLNGTIGQELNAIRRRPRRATPMR